MTSIGLVGCSRLKLSHPAPAAQLYCSPLFRLAARYCALTCELWFVLSARHGLVSPDQVIAPYDLTLKHLGRPEREEWAGRVARQLRERGLLGGGHRLVLHAGADYAGPLARFVRVEQPLEGLPISQRLAWYRRRLTLPGQQEKAMTEKLTLPALEVRQGDNVLYCFAVDGKQVQRFAAVSRLGRDEDGGVLGYQRPEVTQHVAQIRAYLETAGAMLPNALVVAFNASVRFSPLGKGASGSSRVGTLTIPLDGGEREKVGWLVDGQQRAAALRAARVEAFPVCVVGFVAASAAKQREQFILVNSTKPLPRGLLYELLPETDAPLPAALQKYRLPSLLLDRLNRDDDSPLRGLVRTPTSPDGVIKDTSVLKMLDNSLNDGALYFFRERGKGASNVEGMLCLVKDFWSAVAVVFEEAWGKPAKQSRLSGGPGVVTLGYLMDTIVDRHRHRGLPSRAQFEADLEPLRPVCRWTGGFWDFGSGRQRRWDELQNTTADLKLLSNYLVIQYKELVWNQAGAARSADAG